MATMNYRRLGRSGLRVSELSFGSWVTFNKQVDAGLAQRMFGVCFDAGINFFDTSNSYSDGTSEEITGRALRDFARREEVVIATKAFFPQGKGPNQRGLSRKALMAEMMKGQPHLMTQTS